MRNYPKNDEDNNSGNLNLSKQTNIYKFATRNYTTLTDNERFFPPLLNLLKILIDVLTRYMKM